MPPKIKPKPLKHRELLKKIKSFGIIKYKERGKGSEAKLIVKSKYVHGKKYKGNFITIKNHGEGTEHSIRVIDAVLRRFDINPNDFWKK